MSALTLVLQSLQIASGFAWLLPMALFAPAVWRIWRAPMHGPSRADPIDVLVSPIAFMAALNVGFIIRWVLFPAAIETMGRNELIIWAGLYTLSIAAAVLSVRAWRIARGVR
ncbi:MAG TPA: hypothetical protein VFJ46_17825 [Xanthobacteraceae bacterium]|nr:hypothetical protein [Xanthobacteraceae bacterium]